jgi:hypothetical protein
MFLRLCFQDIISGVPRQQHKLRREERCNVTFAAVCTHPMASSAVFCLSLQIRECILRRSGSVALEQPTAAAMFLCWSLGARSKAGRLRPMTLERGFLFTLVLCVGYGLAIGLTRNPSKESCHLSVRVIHADAF